MIDPLSADALVLETERLRLTPLAPQDEDIACALLCDPAVMRYVDDPMTPQAVRAHMSDAVKRGAGGRIGIWCVTLKETGQKIGDAVLTPVPIDAPDIEWDRVVPGAYPDAQIEVGYLLIPSAWGQGFATEICARLLRFAFEQTALAEVVATTDPGNAKSQAVLGKCGLRPLGRKRAYGYDDVCWFEITRPEWQAGA
ncbi:GNAT family N-acetyltransferase [Aestuariivita sp.]|uniref:GNAT family N-acetyltransferase n=1 Tax=Aestuariivita sp. TaxID=1872407 RepID=UPI00216E82CA|nr:GNAT family N-acetyltransferase [Aestuariivita sp.]MCE8006377.1 GNAT family N-acetyltransferase [Aestuariivita sp.]